MAIPKVRPAVVEEKHMDLRFISDDHNIMNNFWDEMAPEIMDIVHEAMIEPARAMGFHITVIDSGSDWIKWRVTSI